MENDDTENEEKKPGKHIYAIRLSLTCHFLSLLFPPKPIKRTNLELDDQSDTSSVKKKVETVNSSVTNEVGFQNLANCKL